jgi:hypothetical protein
MTAAGVDERTELERIEAWRLQELERAGYPAEVATAIAARHDVDLHGAIGLLEKGCPPEIAGRILL